MNIVGLLEKRRRKDNLKFLIDDWPSGSFNLLLKFFQHFSNPIFFNVCFNAISTKLSIQFFRTLILRFVTIVYSLR